MTIQRYNVTTTIVEDDDGDPVAQLEAKEADDGLWVLWKDAQDAERYQFLAKHWTSIYKGKPLWRYIEEDGLMAGGMTAILDDAMSIVKLGRK